MPKPAAARDCAFLSVRKLARALSQHYDEVLQPAGLRATQFSVVRAIGGTEPVALPDLAAALRVDRSTLTRNLAPLARAGLVRLADRRGERARFARLTAKGKRTLARATPLWEQAQARFLEQVGRRRWRSLRKEIEELVTAAEDA